MRGKETQASRRRRESGGATPAGLARATDMSPRDEQQTTDMTRFISGLLLRKTSHKASKRAYVYTRSHRPLAQFRKRSVTLLRGSS